VKRWGGAFLVAFLAALPILFAWNKSAALLEDSDTKGILAAIRLAHDPLKWFRGDWPIANHFYRPISSLIFEFDNAVWGSNAAGYGLTNAFLCFACVLLLFWALREVTDRPRPSAAGAALFAIWHLGPSSPVGSISVWVGRLAWLTLFVGVWRHRKDWKSYLPAFFILLTLSNEILPIRPLAYRMIDWIPGRTASTMTVFALVAIAAYARYERLRRAPAEAAAITPETPPATRSTQAPQAGKQAIAWPWAFVAFLGTVLAIGSYEQGVMVPPVLLVVALAFRVTGARPHWALHAAFFSLIPLYMGLRWGLLPHTVSSYQHQQYSSTRTAFWAEMEYVFPPLAKLFSLAAILGNGPLILLSFDSSGPYAPFADTLIYANGYFQARKEAALVLFGWVGASVAFLPMAWFKLFEHYHYWPMALRSAFVVVLGLVAIRQMAIAWCPPGQPAPLRQHPAPGSLPRP
jgi:hypothetical protein